MFFDGWDSIYRPAVLGILAYGALIVLLRTSGKRTLTKMNAFDLVVTVALGSTLATILLSADVTLSSGVTALATLIGLQYAVAWTSLRWPSIEHAVKSTPSVLVLRGVVQWDELRRQRVSEAEVRAAIRQAGLLQVEQAGVVVLETDGTFNVVSADHLPEDVGRRIRVGTTDV